MPSFVLTHALKARTTRYTNPRNCSRDGLIKPIGGASAAKAQSSYRAFTDGLKAVPFKEPDLTRASLRAQASFRLNLLQERVDLLLALQRVEPAIDVVAQHLPFGPAQSE